MADGSNLKAKIGMDTGDFEKGAKRVTKAAQSMGKDIGTSLTDVGNALGVDVGILGDLSKRIGDATTLFKNMGSAGGSAAGALTRAMTSLGGAIAGLGLTAAIAAFRELNNQAANFEQRLQGVNLAASAKAYRDAYSQTLYDASGAGNFWANFKERSKNYFATNMAQIGTLFTTNAGDRAQAVSNAERAAQLASDMVEYKRQERTLGTEIQRINNQILSAQNTFRDAQASVTERKQAEATITELVNQKYAKQIALQQSMLANVRERNSLTTSTEAELDEEANLERGILALEGQRQQELNSMLRTSNSIANAGSKQASAAKETQQATELTLAAATQMVERQRELQAIQDQNNAMMAAARFSLDGGLAGGPGIQPGQAQRMTVPALVRPVVDPQEWIDVSEELKGIIEDALGSIGDSIGQLMGDLATGGDAWGNFTNNAIQAFGEMATTVGKIAVSTGLATLGIKAALESLNPYVAIAAGTALIALGAAVRAGMANAASGSYSTSVASSAYSSSGTFGQSSFGREMEVKVTGTLTANGSKLVAVLNNEKNRTDYTT